MFVTYEKMLTIILTTDQSIDWVPLQYEVPYMDAQYSMLMHVREH